MKISRWRGAVGAVVALGAAGFIATSSASAVTVTVTAGAGSSVHCDIAGSAKLSQALVNNWDHTAHTNDPNSNATIKAAVASIPNTPYATPGTVTTAAKLTGTCTGTVTDGTHSTGVASVTISASTVNAGDGTCNSLITGVGSDTFTSVLAWKSTTSTKIASTTLTSTLGALFDSHGAGFELQSSGTGITGSFGGGSADNKAYIDATTLNAELGVPSTFGTPSASVCEATLTSKFTPAATGASDAISIKLKKPKGLKAITIGGGTFDNAPSNIDISR